MSVCCIILCAVGDLGLAIIQDVPDDRDAGHLVSTTHQVFRLLKGHYPASCKEPGCWSTGPGLTSFLAPSLPPPIPGSRGMGWKFLHKEAKGLKKSSRQPGKSGRDRDKNLRVGAERPGAGRRGRGTSRSQEDFSGTQSAKPYLSLPLNRERKVGCG